MLEHFSQAKVLKNVLYMPTPLEHETASLGNNFVDFLPLKSTANRPKEDRWERLQMKQHC